MAGIISKVKDALTGDKHHDDTHTGTTGTHSSTTGTTGTHHTTAGPHSSDLANKADPRVDSDRDGRTGLGSNTGGGLTGGHHNTTGTGLTGSHNTTGTGLTGGLVGGLTGGHHTSDRDGRSGYTGPAGAGQHTLGPHSSDLANKADPRVDSDGDRHRGVGTGHSTSTAANLPLGATPQGLVHGHHTTVTGEKLDPHISGQTTGVSSGITTGTTGSTGTTGYTGTSGTGTSGSGTSGSTAPHNSSLLNKLDPRVNT